MAVSSGQVLNIYVGGRGGYNGGGSGGSSPFPGASGGGASDIRFGSNKLIIAGGGGGGGGKGRSSTDPIWRGGAGGSAAASGGDGFVTSYVIQNQSGGYSARATWGEVNLYSAKGGTLWAGGSGGSFGVSGYAGAAGASSSGGAGASGTGTSSGGGGGGGGGYFGGGGGAVGSAFSTITQYPGAGGGAGSSFAHGDLTAFVEITTASSVSDGYVVLKTSARIPQSLGIFQIATDRIVGIPFSLPNLTASSGLPVAFSVQSGNGTISGNNFTPLSLGNTTLRASQAGNSFYSPVTANATFQVVDADSDADGLLNSYEISISQTNPQNPDSDSDGVMDGLEVNSYGTNPQNNDTDADGLNDGSEINTYGTNPKNSDTDADGLSDFVEINTHGTDPKKADTDGDTLTDATEINFYTTDPKKSDTDGDGLTDLDEIVYCSFPQIITGGPWTWNQAKADAISRGGRLAVFRNLSEWQNFVNKMPATVTDGWIGLTDEVTEGQWKWVNGMSLGFSAWLSGQPDNSGNEPYVGWMQSSRSWNDFRTNSLLPNYAFQKILDPKKPDTDGDGLTDFVEINISNSDPIVADSDLDGYLDGIEFLALKTNPLVPNDTPGFTLVGNPKNPDEDNAGYDVENAGIGYVGQEFEIGTTEITNLMYSRFLNAIAKSDTLYGLYNTFMGTDVAGGIVRNGASGNYSYTVKSGFENRPVNFVSIYDTLRYINWLHNGMPTTGVQDSSTTENGAYKLLGANPRDAVRNAGAKFFLPDQDEWHKAAFFDPDPGQGRPSDSYWPYADQSTSGPGGNFQSSRVNIGATSGKSSHYGTYDQGGNVWEWTETVLTNGNRLISQGNRPMTSALTTRETADLGFRVGRTVMRNQTSPLVVPQLTAVGEEFNLGDDTNGNRGAVVYEFQMGKYEVTNSEYAGFLNAVAKTDSFYGLYNTRMGTDAQGGILRSGQNGNFTYTVKSGFEKKPVNFVGFYNAMRFCNWLHNGAQPDGDTESGAYRLLGNIPPNTATLRRNAGARYFLPTEDEWYKAAFHDTSVAGMMTGNYWNYAVKSDQALSTQINFLGAFAGVSDVDVPGFPSFFGTFGQSGNVAEWTETVSSTMRIVRGGHYASSNAGVSSTGILSIDPYTTSANTGFRIAAAKGTQYLSNFAAIPNKTFGDPPFSVPVPSASSGLPVTLSVRSGPASVSGNTVTILGAGDVVLVANQPGNDSFDPASEAVAAFTVLKRNQSISSFPTIGAKLDDDPPFAILFPTSSAGLPVFVTVKSGPASISNSTVSILGEGTVVLAANQPGDANNNPAAEVITSFPIRTPQQAMEVDFSTWISTYGSISLSKRGLNDDADLDGMPNFAEFALARNPSSAAPHESPAGIISGNRFLLDFKRRKSNAAQGIATTIETSTSLVSGWQLANGQEQILQSDNQTESVRVSLPVLDNSKQFFRIKVAAGALRAISSHGNLTFGEATLNTSAQRTFVISNTGTRNMTVSGITYPSGFTGNWSGGVIAPGGSQTVAVTFQPGSAQSFGGYIFVNSNASSGTISIPVSGIGQSRIIGLSGNMSFGNATVKIPIQRTLTLSNTGTGNLTVSGITFPLGFSGNWSSGTIPAGGSQNVTVTFLPPAPQSYSGNITIASDASSGVPIINCSGIGQARIIGLSGNMSFGNITVDTQMQRTLTISNTGTGPMAISGINYPSGFTGNWSSGAIPAGGSQNVTITFLPTLVQNYSGNITIASDASSGIGSMPCDGVGIARTRIISISGNLSFGNVTLDSQLQRPMTISNIGTGNLTITGITYPVGFSGNWVGTIAPGSSQSINVTFNPNAAQTYGGDVSVASNASAGSGLVAISGVGVQNFITVEGGSLPQSSGLSPSPWRRQVVATFRIGKYEVTWDEWQEVRAWAVANGYSDLANVGAGSAGNHPVRNMNWYDVVKWCNAKSEREGLTPVYKIGSAVYKIGLSDAPAVNSNANGYRLPSEAEWEWAAMGGLSSLGYTYSGSNDGNSVGWNSGNSMNAEVDIANTINATWLDGGLGRGTWPMGLKMANELGIYDMTGNVAEWLFDSYVEYSTAYGNRLYRRFRGGSWASPPTAITLRAYSFPNWSNSQIGLRLARNAPQ